MARNEGGTERHHYATEQSIGGRKVPWKENSKEVKIRGGGEKSHGVTGFWPGIAGRKHRAITK